MFSHLLSILLFLILVATSFIIIEHLFQFGYSYQGSPIAVDSDTNVVYISSNKTIIGIDGDSGRIMAKFPVQARDIVVNSRTHELYGFDVGFDGHAVIRLNLTKGAISGSTNISNSPWAFDLDPIDDILYAADDESSVNLVAINGRAMKQSMSIELPDIIAYNIAIDPLSHKVYVLDYDNAVVYSINSSDFSVIHKIPIVPLPEDIAINPETGFVYISNRESTRVTVINGSNDHVVKNLVTGNFSRDYNNGGSSLTIDIGSNMVYLADYERKRITLINGSTNTIARSVATDFSPAGISVNSKNGALYIYDDQSLGVARLTNNNSIVHLLGDQPQNRYNSANPRVNYINVGKGASEIGMDTDKQRIFVMNAVSSSIYVIDSISNSVIDVIRLDHTPTNLKVVPERDLLLVTYKETPGIYLIDADSKKTVGKLNISSNANLNLDSGVGGILVSSSDKYNSTIIWISRENEMTKTSIGLGHINNVALNSIAGIAYLSGPNLAIWDISRNESKVLPRSLINDPGPIAINQITNQIYVLVNRDNYKHYFSLYTVDGYMNSVEQILNLKSPVGFSDVAINERTDTLYASGNNGEHPSRGFLIAINASTNKIIKNITFGIDPISVAVNPNSNIIYVVDDEVRSISTIDGERDCVRFI